MLAFVDHMYAWTCSGDMTHPHVHMMTKVSGYDIRCKHSVDLSKLFKFTNDLII